MITEGEIFYINIPVRFSIWQLLDRWLRLRQVDVYSLGDVQVIDELLKLYDFLQVFLYFFCM